MRPGFETGASSSSTHSANHWTTEIVVLLNKFNVILSGDNSLQTKTPLSLNNNGSTSKSSHLNTRKWNSIVNKLLKINVHISAINFLQCKNQRWSTKRAKYQRELRKSVARCRPSQVPVQDANLCDCWDGQLSQCVKRGDKRVSWFVVCSLR